MERQRTYSSIKRAGRSSLRNLIPYILSVHQDDSDTWVADSMFLEARKVRAKPPGLAPLESPIPLQLSKGNRIRQQRRHLEIRLPVSGLESCAGCHPERSEGSLRPSSQTLRGVYPERSAWAQGDSQYLQMSGCIPTNLHRDSLRKTKNPDIGSSRPIAYYHSRYGSLDHEAQSNPTPILKHVHSVITGMKRFYL